MKKPFTQIFTIFNSAFVFTMTGVAALPNSTTETGERIVYATPGIPPVWITSSGAYIEVSGSYVVNGDGSAFLRIADEERPFVLVFDNHTGFQMGGGLPRDVAELEGERAREPKTVVWRVQIRGLNRDMQRVKLEQKIGTWMLVESKEVAIRNLENWVSEDAVLIFGLAGDVELGENPNVRIVREGSLFLIN